ncbi:hypothetical protein OAT16_02805 [Prolixibacteraceae bacterium]|nr:hypothetical protein [Prolixibacteraceae bacterium]
MRTRSMSSKMLSADIGRSTIGFRFFSGVTKEIKEPLFESIGSVRILTPKYSILLVILRSVNGILTDGFLINDMV